MENMRFKVGDRVRIKSIDWYNKNKDNYGAIYAGNGFGFWKKMVRHCGEIMKITSVKVDPEDSNKGFYFMENSDEKWTDGMIEGLAEEEIGLVDNLSSRWVNEFNLPDGYIFKDENGNVINAMKIVLEKKKKEYPKTYEECCRIVNANPCIRLVYNLSDGQKYYHDENNLYLYENFRRLKICRDAYWKIAGDEMGLGKPWEPDWIDGEWKWCVCYSNNNIEFDSYKSIHHTFSFPTEEMRNSFYESFKELIESVKELL